MMLELAVNRRTVIPEYPDATDVPSAKLTDLVTRHGCKFLAMHPAARGAQTIDDVIISSSWPENILAQNTRFLPAVNFELAHRISRTIVPFKWAFGIIDSASRTKADEKLLDLIYEFQRSDCWIIPVHAPHGNTGLVVIGELEKQLTAHDIANLQSASFELFDHQFKQIQNSRTNDERLCATEVRILQFMIDGKSTIEIATLIKLSPFAVAAYISNAKSKLNSKTNTQAVAQAIRNGEIG